MLLFAGCLAAVLFLLHRLALRVRRRGIGAVVMAPVDEVWRPHQHLLRLEIEADAERASSQESGEGTR